MESTTPAGTDSRPRCIKGDLAHIPGTLRDRAQWVTWRYVQRDGRWTKVPLKPGTTRPASSTDPATWTDFHAAADALLFGPPADGLGFVFTGDITGLDFDKCLAPDGQLLPDRADIRELVEALDSYTEVSPSGTGLHVYVAGSYPGQHGFKSDRLELYTKGRFFCVTGKPWGPARDLAARPAALARLAESLPVNRSSAGEVAGYLAGDGNLPLVSHFPNLAPDVAEALSAGSPDPLGGDHSTADYLVAKGILAAMAPDPRDEAALAHACQSIEAAISASGLGARSKWQDRPDYRARTIQRALDAYRAERPETEFTPVPKAAPALNGKALALDFDLSGNTMARLLNTPPPPREFLVDGFLPARIVALLTAPGGSGKSMLLLQLAWALATGGEFLGFSIPTPRRVLYLAAEDSLDELHRRLWALREYRLAEAAMHDELELDGHEAVAAQVARVAANFTVGSATGSGVDLRLITEDGRYTGFVEALAAKVSAWRPDLVVLDPAIRFMAGDENDAVLMTRFISGVERLAESLGVAVLLAHHANKAAIRDPSSDTQAVARGSSALVSGARLHLHMAQVTEALAKSVEGLDPVEVARRRYLRVAQLKANYGAPMDPVWLQKQEGSPVLLPVQVTLKSAGDQAAAVVNCVAALEARGLLPMRLREFYDRHMRVQPDSEGLPVTGVPKARGAEIMRQLREAGRLRVEERKSGGPRAEVVLLGVGKVAEPAERVDDDPF